MTTDPRPPAETALQALERARLNVASVRLSAGQAMALHGELRAAARRADAARHDATQARTEADDLRAIVDSLRAELDAERATTASLKERNQASSPPGFYIVKSDGRRELRWFLGQRLDGTPTIDPQDNE